MIATVMLIFAGFFTLYFSTHVLVKIFGFKGYTMHEMVKYSSWLTVAFIIAAYVAIFSA